MEKKQKRQIQKCKTAMRQKAILKEIITLEVIIMAMAKDRYLLLSQLPSSTAAQVASLGI